LIYYQFDTTEIIFCWNCWNRIYVNQLAHAFASLFFWYLELWPTCLFFKKYIMQHVSVYVPKLKLDLTLDLTGY